MAALSSLFPSYTPQLSNKLWFNCESSATISSDAELQKEEEQYTANLKEEVDIKLTTVGQTKEETEQTGNIYLISISQDCSCSSSGSWLQGQLSRSSFWDQSNEYKEPLENYWLKVNFLLLVIL